jgi:hypothetical protein
MVRDYVGKFFILVCDFVGKFCMLVHDYVGKFCMLVSSVWWKVNWVVVTKVNVLCNCFLYVGK